MISPVLEKELTTDMKEKKERLIEIVDFKAGPIKEMLRFFYGGTPDFENLEIDVLCDLFRAANK